MNLIELFRDRALKQPHFPAIIDRDRGGFRSRSFGDIERDSQCLARLFQQHRLQPEDGVLIFYPLSVELYIILAAVFRLGLVAIFLDPATGKKHIDRCCQLYPPKAFIASPKAHFLQIICPSLRQIPLKISVGCPFPQTISWQTIERLSPYTDIYPSDRDSPALLTFTSGSTGQPKAAIRTQEFLFAQYQILKRTLQLQPEELELSTLPIFILANLASGLTSLIPDVNLRIPGKIKANRVIRQIHQYQPSRLVSSPAFLVCLMDWCRDRSLILPQIKKIFVGGAPVMPQTLSQLKIIFPAAQITVVYGSTEAEPIASIDTTEITREDWQKMRSGCGLLVGKPVPEIKLKLFSSSVEKIENSENRDCNKDGLPLEKVGEIMVRGNHVLTKYLEKKIDKNVDKTQKIHRDRKTWHPTGDMGYLDEKGRLWLLGPRSGCLRDRFGILYPFTVECAVHCHPEIKRSAVVSWQGKRILLIEFKRNTQQFDFNALQKTLRDAKIESINICTQIPVDRRHNGKIDYARLNREISKNNFRKDKNFRFLSQKINLK